MLRFLSRANLGTKGEVFDAGADLSNSFVSELVSSVVFSECLHTVLSCFPEDTSSCQLWLSLQVLQRCDHLHFHPPAAVCHQSEAVVFVGYSESDH